MWTNPLNGEDVRPEVKLAVAVLLLAIEDAIGKVRAKMAHHNRRQLQEEADLWLSADSPDLMWWCATAGTTPAEVRALRTFRSMSMSKSEKRRSKTWTSEQLAGAPEIAPTPAPTSRGRRGDEGQ